ncbi:MAG: tyrosine-type recombinase/integrase [Phycisphaerales bacterium JB039]
MRTKKRLAGEAARLAWARGLCRRHKANGRAYIRWNGDQIRLGCDFGADDMAERALRAIDLAEAGHEVSKRRSAMTVADLVKWIEKRSPVPPKRAVAFGRLTRLFGDLPAAEFGRRELKTVRASLLQLSPSEEALAEWDPDSGEPKPKRGRPLTRATVNEYIGAIVWAFREAASEDLLPGLWRDLADVRPLRQGKSEAPEGEEVPPVADETIEKTLPECSPIVGDMIRVLRLSGMRAGELCAMTAGDLDTSGDVWIYRPKMHKTKHHGKTRQIALPAKAQAIIERHMTTDLAAPIFRTDDGQKRFRGGPYTTNSLRRAIHRACDRAEVERWNPHQIRHTVATELLRAGLQWSEVAAVCGHSQTRTTLAYAKPDHVLTAERAAKLIGSAKVG